MFDYSIYSSIPVPTRLLHDIAHKAHFLTILNVYIGTCAGFRCIDTASSCDHHRLKLEFEGQEPVCRLHAQIAERSNSLTTDNIIISRNSDQIGR